MKNKYPALTLKPGRDRSLRKGHPWIFSGAVAAVAGHPRSGDIVLAAAASGEPLALGFYNPATDIIFRLLTKEVSATIDETFWQHRVKLAIALRHRILPPDTTAFRLINAEGDGLPGLVVDRYGDHLVVTIGTAGMERCREIIIDVLIRELKPQSIYERSDGRSRQMEGLLDHIGPAYGDDPPERIDILENGLSFEVDVVSGQKTGFFLDQRRSRECLEKVSRDASVLNCFSYTGAFSAYCARGGAKRVISIEASASANATALRNIARNGFSPDQHPVIQADVFTRLREMEDIFDLIILDPPAFSKSRKDVARAAKGYKEINLQAAHRLRAGGFLATFSCSNHIEESLFEKIVLGAVTDAGKTAGIVERLGAGGDHPVNLAHPEGRYLKGLLLVLH